MATEHRSGSGNFADDRQKASEAGKKGGHASHQQGDSHQSRSHQSGGNFAQDHEKASEAGRKGGYASHGGKS
jgi:general stress protein YciG